MRTLSMKIVAVTAGIGGLCVLLKAAAPASPSPDARVLAMIPEGAVLVSSLLSGQQVSYLVMTRDNTTDLTDFQSITGSDPARVIGRVVLVTTSNPQVPRYEHSLLASGQFDFPHIVKSALQNGAARGEYRGVPILILQPLERDRTTSQDVRWLANVDAKILLFGSIPNVQQELDRYLDASRPDLLLVWRLSRLRHKDQSWCVVASSLRETELVRRSLAPLDPALESADHAKDALVLGMHFGSFVEIEYENEPDSIDPGQFATSSSSVDDPQPVIAGPVSRLRNASEMDYHTLKVSRKQYDAWIARQGSPGEPPIRDDQLKHKKPSRAGKGAGQK
jgi:hypothetical protein